MNRRAWFYGHVIEPKSKMPLRAHARVRSNCTIIVVYAIASLLIRVLTNAGSQDMGSAA